MRSPAFDGIAEVDKPQSAPDGVSEATKPRKKNINLQERQYQSRKAYRKKASPALFNGIPEVASSSRPHDGNAEVASSSNDGIAEMALHGPPGIFYASHAPPAFFPDLSEVASSSNDGIAEVAKQMSSQVVDCVQLTSALNEGKAELACSRPQGDLYAGHASPTPPPFDGIAEVAKTSSSPVHFTMYDDASDVGDADDHAAPADFDGISVPGSDDLASGPPNFLGIAEEAKPQPIFPEQYVALSDILALQQQQQQQLLQLTKYNYAAVMPTPLDGFTAEVAQLRTQLQEFQTSQAVSSTLEGLDGIGCSLDEIAEVEALRSALEGLQVAHSSEETEVAQLRSYELDATAEVSALCYRLEGLARSHELDEIAEVEALRSAFEGLQFSHSYEESEVAKLRSCELGATAEVSALCHELEGLQFVHKHALSCEHGEIAEVEALRSALEESRTKLEAHEGLQHATARSFDLQYLASEAQLEGLEHSHQEEQIAYEQLEREAKLNLQCFITELAEVGTLHTELEGLESARAVASPEFNKSPNGPSLSGDAIAEVAKLREELAQAHANHEAHIAEHNVALQSLHFLANHIASTR